MSMSETITPAEPVARTIRDAAEAWLSRLETRKRKPVKRSSLACFSSYLTVHIFPRIGDKPIESFANAAMREFVRQLAQANLSPKLILEVSSCVRRIISSVQTEEGDEIYPRRWNAEIIDAPSIGKQHTPIVTKAQVEKAIDSSSDPYKILYALLAGSGLRISEARALRIGDDGKHSCLDFENATLHIRSAMWRGSESTTKTAAGVRTVEIPHALNEFLLSNLWLDPSLGGFLFANRNGGPAHESTLRKSLANLDLGDVSFHSFRRFYTTHLRSASVPEEIIKALLGHSRKGSVTDGYSKLSEDASARRLWVENAGLGFTIPQATQPIKSETIREVEPAFAEATL